MRIPLLPISLLPFLCSAFEPSPQFQLKTQNSLFTRSLYSAGSGGFSKLVSQNLVDVQPNSKTLLNNFVADEVSDSTLTEYDILGFKVDSKTLTLYINGLLILSLFSFTMYDLLTANAEYARGWTLQEYLNRLPGDNLLRYESSAGQNPILTKALTSMVAYGIGDFTTQVLQGRTLENIDLKRSGRSAFAGFIGHGPLCHFWIEFMETYLNFGGAWWAVFPKVFADQTVWSLYLNAMYVAITNGLQFKSPAHIWNEIKTTCVPALQCGWRFWPFIHLISFSSLLPVTFKLLFIDAMEIVWVTILSRVTQDVDYSQQEGEGGEAVQPSAINALDVMNEVGELMKDTSVETQVTTPVMVAQEILVEESKVFSSEEFSKKSESFQRSEQV
mmetsp:Transcript_8674/g.11425  ORF Transcript_8674/g.11425 Transcript_8674/m.11425 type:complete len:387 (-) Transcript_8674:245-1405(-)